MALKNNTWKLNQWYDQSVAGNVTYTGAGALYGWGRNGNNRSLGLNDTVTRSSPTQIPGTTWKQVAGATGNMAAVKTDGTLWSWGYQNRGELGQNNTTKYSSPVQIPGTKWTNVEGSFYGGYALKST